IFVASHSIAYQALVQQGAVFSDRPKAGPVSSNQRNINTSPYGPIWRLLRRNLTSEILHPSRIKSYSKARSWVLARIRTKEQKIEHGDEFVVAYVDTLLNLELPEEKRNLNHGEIVTLCNEFLSAGTDTTSTALQWVMANLVKNPSIQEKLYQEIASVVGEKQSKLTDEEAAPTWSLCAATHSDRGSRTERLRHPKGCHHQFHGCRDGSRPKGVGGSLGV
ncbi:hypothetical protein MTR67_014277, partial [Solanum verrucosum]